MGRHSINELSAGIAEAQTPIVFGAGAAVFTAVVAAIAARRHPNAASPNRIALVIAIIAAAIAALEPLSAFIVTSYASPPTLVAVAAFLALGAIAAFIAARGAAFRPLLVAAAAEICVGVEGWLVLRHFAHIALYGR